MFQTILSAPTAFADFNMASPEGLIPVAVQDYRGITPPEPGTWIRLIDEDDNSCDALIVSRSGDLFRANIVWDSWQAGQILEVTSRWQGDTVDYQPEANATPVKSSTRGLLRTLAGTEA